MRCGKRSEKKGEKKKRRGEGRAGENYFEIVDAVELECIGICVLKPA